MAEQQQKNVSIKELRDQRLTKIADEITQYILDYSHSEHGLWNTTLVFQFDYPKKSSSLLEKLRNFFFKPRTTSNGIIHSVKTVRMIDPFVEETCSPESDAVPQNTATEEWQRTISKIVQKFNSIQGTTPAIDPNTEGTSNIAYVKHFSQEAIDVLKIVGRNLSSQTDEYTVAEIYPGDPLVITWSKPKERNDPFPGVASQY